MEKAFSKEVIDSLQTKRRRINKHKIPRSSKRLSFGYFKGSTIFRNSLHPDEGLKDGHITLANLVPPNVQRLLITSYEVELDDPKWFLQDMWGRDPKPNHCIIVHKGTNIIGQAKLSPITTKESNWYFLQCRPHTGGCNHSKIFLFRTPQGLRVVISGNNFCKMQWESDRDCLWVQDFLVTSSGGDDYDDDDDDSSFALQSFLQDLCQCHHADDQFLVEQHLEAMFNRIAFSVAQASFVYSFPRPSSDLRKDRGGWRQLTRMVQERILSEYDTDRENEIAYRSFQTPMLYAMSGSYGDVEPVFLSAMKNAMSGQDTLFANEPLTWESLDGIQCLMPSIKMAQKMNIGGGRLMDRTHWAKIPNDARQRLFNDTQPNPSTGLNKKLPFAHCKVMYFHPRETLNTAFLYVGSHNFSKNAWGIADKVRIHGRTIIVKLKNNFH
jgi:hypothetical protein